MLRTAKVEKAFARVCHVGALLARKSAEDSENKALFRGMRGQSGVNSPRYA